MKTAVIRRFLLSLAFLALLGGAALAQVEPLNPPERVSVAYVPIMKFAPLYVAAERGLFEALGLDVEINRVASGTEAIAFLTEGQIDVGGIAIVTSLWNGWNRGLDIRVIAPGGLEPFENSPTNSWCARTLRLRRRYQHRRSCGRTVSVAGGPGGEESTWPPRRSSARASPSAT